MIQKWRKLIGEKTTIVAAGMEAGWPNAQVAAAGPAKHLQACLVF